MSEGIENHLPLRVSDLTPSGIKTADDMNISISWSSNCGEWNAKAEKMAEFIVTACNEHDRLKAENERLRGELHFIAEYPYKFGQHVQHLKERAHKALKGGDNNG